MQYAAPAMPTQAKHPMRPGLSTSVAVERIRDMITTGDLAPGRRLTEREIGDRLNLSRTPVREALKILHAEGLVILEPNRGAVVPLLSGQEVEEVMEVLSALEKIAAPLVCSRLTEAELARIEALHDEMVTHFRAGRLMPYFSVNQAIHRAIVAASGNRTVARIYSRESGRIQRYRFAGNRDGARWERAVHEHGLILDALRQRDGELLAALLRAHLKAGWRAARGSLPELVPRPSSE